MLLLHIAPAVSDIYSAKVSAPIKTLVKKPVVAVRTVEKKEVVVAWVVVLRVAKKLSITDGKADVEDA